MPTNTPAAAQTVTPTNLDANNKAFHVDHDGTVSSKAGYKVGSGLVITSAGLLKSATMFVGAITTTAASSDTITASVTPAHCLYQDTNSTAAALTGEYIRLSGTTITLNHSVSAGGTVDIYCTY